MPPVPAHRTSDDAIRALSAGPRIGLCLRWNSVSSSAGTVRQESAPMATTDHPPPASRLRAWMLEGLSDMGRG
ncbi:hypothetical protein ABZX69_27600, partial [Streptomyces sp. NPDC004074]|uniref:hypothetical protein n=1 Tax=unclassified Streptomyces TaxID=2593676 RepID=UPI0033B5F30F